MTRGMQVVIKKLQIMNIVRSYKLVLKDRNYMLLISGFSIIMMGEFSISSYIAIRLKDQFETISIGSYDITGAKMLAILLMINTVVVIFTHVFNLESCIENRF